MKTLKQIRENIEDKLLDNVDFASNEVMLEDHGSTKPSAQIPSQKRMPTMLLFRRITYRTYPKGQVVALYYSKMVDKYLSIPFGPGGNLNLSESQVYDTWEDLEEGLVDWALKKAGSWAMKKLTGGKDEKQAPAAAAPEDKPSVSTSHPKLKAAIGHVETKNKGDASFQSKMRQATLKSVTNPSVSENKISDIRKMIKENVESTDININGRQITLNNSMAKRILEVYDSVNTKNKRIVESMLNEDLESFKKLLNFSIRN